MHLSINLSTWLCLCNKNNIIQKNVYAKLFPYIFFCLHVIKIYNDHYDLEGGKFQNNIKE